MSLAEGTPPQGGLRELRHSPLRRRTSRLTVKVDLPLLQNLPQNLQPAPIHLTDEPTSDAAPDAEQGSAARYPPGRALITVLTLGV